MAVPQPSESYSDKLDARLLRIAGVCVLAVVMAIMDTTVVGVAQRTFITEFESTQAVVAWTLTGYTLALASVIPLAGWVADRFGTKRPFMGSVLAFTLGSLLCATAPNITSLIAFRVVQGLGGGMLMPLAITILTREAGPRRIGRLMAVLGIPMLLGPIGGPILGGWLIDTYSWEWIFGINVPIGFSAFVLAAITFPHDRATPSESFDFIGMLLLSPGLATLLYGVSSIPGRGTVADPHVWLPVATGLVLISGFVLHALYQADHPLIDLRLFKNREVTAANATMLLTGSALFGAGLLIPSCFQQVLHQTPLQSGIHMIPERLGAMLVMPVAGVLLDRRGPHKIVLIGVTLITAGMATFGYGVWTQANYLPVLLVGLALMGMGLGCTAMPLMAAAVQSLATHQIARGSALANVNLQVARVDQRRIDVGDSHRSVQPQQRHLHRKPAGDPPTERGTPRCGAEPVGDAATGACLRFHQQCAARPVARLHHGVRGGCCACGGGIHSRGISAEEAGRPHPRPTAVANPLISLRTGTAAADGHGGKK